jgi:hypothetical protein
MKTFVFSILLCGCATTSGTSPDNEFKTGKEVVSPAGCTLLKKQIEIENKKNGTNKKANC